MHLSGTLQIQKKVVILIQLSSLCALFLWLFFNSTSCLWPRHLIQCDASQASWRNTRKSPQTEISSETMCVLASSAQFNHLVLLLSHVLSVLKCICYIYKYEKFSVSQKQADFTEHKVTPLAEPVLLYPSGRVSQSNRATMFTLQGIQPANSTLTVCLHDNDRVENINFSQILKSFTNSQNDLCLHGSAKTSKTLYYSCQASSWQCHFVKKHYTPVHTHSSSFNQKWFLYPCWCTCVFRVECKWCVSADSSGAVNQQPCKTCRHNKGCCWWPGHCFCEVALKHRWGIMCKYSITQCVIAKVFGVILRISNSYRIAHIWHSGHPVTRR